MAGRAVGLSYVATWQAFAYVAFVIDAFARRIVGWRVSRSAYAGFVLDALEQHCIIQTRLGPRLVHQEPEDIAARPNQPTSEAAGTVRRPDEPA